MRTKAAGAVESCHNLGMCNDSGGRHDESDPWRLNDALDGDSAAWAFLVDEFGEQIWRWARNCGLDRHESEEIAQTVWLRVRDKGHTIEDRRTLPGWLRTTTIREASEVQRRRTRTQATDLSDLDIDGSGAMFAPHEVSPSEHTIANDLRDRLSAAFGKLSERCRDLLTMSWSGVSYEEISVALGVAQGSVGPMRGRCLDELRGEAGIEES